MSNKQQLALGGFFVTVLAILGYYTLFLTDFKPFGKQHALVVHFPAANGLRTGDSVLVAGMRKGRVGRLTYDPDVELARRITVDLVLDEEVLLRAGFAIKIEDSTLLGGKQVTIDPGPPEGAAVAAGTMLMGTVAGNALSGLGELVEENRERVAAILGDLEQLTEGLRAGRGTLGMLLNDEEMASSVGETVDRFGVFSDNAAGITTDLREGKGALGRLLTDEDLAGKLGEVGDSLAQITKDIEAFTADLPEGKGLLSRVVKDEVLADDVAAAVKSIRDVVDRINSGEGNLGRLVMDESAMKNLESILRKVDEGEGDLGAFISRNEIYDKLSAVADDLQVASKSLSESKGTLGLLINDDSLYQDLNRAVGLVISSLEEFREAAPVTTFTSVLFGAF